MSSLISQKFTKLEDHKTISSAILDKCIAQVLAEYKKSITKSLSETLSVELLVGLSKPSFLVVKNLSILKKFLSLMDGHFLLTLL